MAEVGDANSFHQPFIHQLFHSLPCVQNVGVTGNHIARLIQWEIYLPRLKTSWLVNKVEVQVVQLEVAEHLQAGSFHQALLMVAAPQLAADEELLMLHHLLPELLLNGYPHLIVIVVHMGTVDVVVPNVNGHFHSLSHLAWRGLPGAHPEDGHLGTIVEHKVAGHCCCAPQIPTRN
ncbi:hypothetical protein P7K49_039864, partial [Saguinus oedipus]